MVPEIRPYQSGRTGNNNVDRSAHLRRDDDEVTVPKVTLYDVDFAVYFHLVENLKLSVLDNGAMVAVPAMFGNGEKWSQIRQNGFLRDESRKVMAPLIIIRRTGMNADERFPFPKLNNFTPRFKVLPYKNMEMQYDRVAGQYVSKQSYTFYTVPVPRYVRVDYELLLWTDMQEQMNQLVQRIEDVSDHLWGDYFTFRSNVQSISHDNVNVPGEDRIIKTTVSLKVDAGLQEEFTYSQSNIQKNHSVKRVRFLQEGTEQILVDQFADKPTERSNISDVNDLSDHFNLRKKIRL